MASGAFGGGRQGVLESEFRTGSDRDRALLQCTTITTRIWSSTSVSGTKIWSTNGI